MLIFVPKSLKAMKPIAIFTLTSPLHDEEAVEAATREFLGGLELDYDYCGPDYYDYCNHSVDLIYVRTGGTEGVFKGLLPDLQKLGAHTFYLLTSGKSNSLAASMEILSFLRQQNLRGEIIHGSAEYIRQRVSLLARVGEARRRLSGCRLGIIGQPSDWLISSGYDSEIIRQKLGIELVRLKMSELLAKMGPMSPMRPIGLVSAMSPMDTMNLEGEAGRALILQALREVVAEHLLQGFTLRCFDLLTAIRNTGCMALATLNAEGLVAGCEGDVPSMLSMMIIRSLTGVSGFQANPARVDLETGELLFAHCTIPLDMVERYETTTHFESGIGIGIRGYMKEGAVTIFKVAGDLSRIFIAEGRLVRNEAKPDLCRTQQIIQLDDPSQARYFLTNPIGNHHIIVPGQHKKELEQILQI